MSRQCRPHLPNQDLPRYLARSGVFDGEGLEQKKRFKIGCEVMTNRLGYGADKVFKTAICPNDAVKACRNERA